jgi:ABC-2 type transport system permease protein
MKTFSEEMKSGTIEIMMTVPISEMQIVVGKFLGVFIYYSVLWIPTLIYPFFLSLYSSLDVGPVVSGYIGTLLIGAFFISIGIFCSSISKSQINSAILSFFILVGLFLLGYLKMVAFNSKLLEVFEYINFSEIIKTYSEGIITTKSLVFLVTSSILCLFINIKFLETRKWL